MSIPRIDIFAIDAFNQNAEVLETVVIGGRKFDMIHDYWHQHPVINYRSSVIVRGEKFGELYPVPSTPFRRNSKNDHAMRAWSRAASMKYLKD